MNKKSWELLLSSAANAIEIASMGPYGTTRFQKKSVLALRPFLPYYLHKADDQNFIWVNRDYKPLGIITEEWIDYMDFPWLHVPVNDPVALLGPFCLFEALPPWASKEHAERLARLIGEILSPSLDLSDTSKLKFRFQHADAPGLLLSAADD